MSDKTLSLLRAFRMGVADAFEVGTLNVGVTWDDPDLNEAYDQGANLGERLARIEGERKEGGT